MATSYPDEIDSLLRELAASLGAERVPFMDAASAAIAAAGATGVGQAFRIAGPIQKQFFTPPPDARAAGARHNRSSKLIAAEAIGRDDPRCDGRLRRQFQAG